MVKIFVGNLSNDVTSDDLAELFAKYGDIEECEKLEHKMFGFVHMVDERSANTAVMKLHRSFYKGTRIIVEISSRKPQKLFVGNINPRTSQDDLREHFETAGANVFQVENCDGKRFGFVRIEISRGYGEVNQLVKRLDGSFLNGNRIKVELSEDKTREEKQRIRMEKEKEQGMIGYESPWEQQSYQPYPVPQRWGPANNFQDFTGDNDNWAPSRQAVHKNKMMGFGAGGGFSKADQDYGDYHTGHSSRGPPAPAGGQHEDDPGATAELLQWKLRSQMFCQGGLNNLDLLQTGEMSDYKLICENMVTHVHKVILAAKSPVFRKLITKEPSSMVVRNMDSLTMRMLLHFIYTGSVEVKDINPVSITNLSNAADVYQVEFIKEGLQASMVENITVDTAVDYLIYSEELQLGELKKVVNQFICSQAKVMKERPDFKTKLSQYPHLIIDLFNTAAN